MKSELTQANSEPKSRQSQKTAAKPLAFLDIRPIRAASSELVTTVLQTLQILPDDGVLKLLTRKQPDALIEQLQNHGYRIGSRNMRDDIWDIEVLGTDTPDIADFRELEAPEPMQRVLLAAGRLGNGQTYFARLPHVPHPLFPPLRERGLRWWVHEEVDQSALLAVKVAP